MNGGNAKCCCRSSFTPSMTAVAEVLSAGKRARRPLHSETCPWVFSGASVSFEALAAGLQSQHGRPPWPLFRKLVKPPSAPPPWAASGPGGAAPPPGAPPAVTKPRPALVPAGRHPPPGRRSAAGGGPTGGRRGIRRGRAGAGLPVRWRSRPGSRGSPPGAAGRCPIPAGCRAACRPTHGARARPGHGAGAAGPGPCARRAR